MKRSAILGVVLALAALAAPALAGAAEVAKVLTFSGTLRTSTGAVETAYKDITFRLYSQLAGGTALFTETLGVQPSTDGTFSVQIGSTTPLDGALFAQQLYLGIQVTGEAEMVPRTQLTPTPYTWSVDWASLRGFPAACPAGQFVTGLGPTLTCSTPPQAVASVVGSGVIQASTAGGTVTVSLASTGCSLGQVLKYGALGWACAEDTDTDTGLLTVSRNATLVGDGTSGAPLGLMTCANGQILKMGATTWGCGADVDTGLTSVSVASPITGNGAGTALGLMSCGANQILKWNGTAWACAADTDTTGLTSVSRDASLVGDGTAGSALGVAFPAADGTGTEGSATTAARSDHSHSQLIQLPLSDAHVISGSLSFNYPTLGGIPQVRALQVPVGGTLVWSQQVGFRPELVPSVVTVSLTSTVYGGPPPALPAVAVSFYVLEAGGTAACALGSTIATPIPATAPSQMDYVEGQAVVLKAGRAFTTECALHDDANLIIQVQDQGTVAWPYGMPLFNAFAQIFF